MAHGSNKTPAAKLERYNKHHKNGVWGFIPLSIIVLGLAAATLAKNQYGSEPVGILAWNIVVVSTLSLLNFGIVFLARITETSLSNSQS